MPIIHEIWLILDEWMLQGVIDFSFCTLTQRKECHSALGVVWMTMERVPCLSSNPRQLHFKTEGVSCMGPNPLRLHFKIKLLNVLMSLTDHLAFHTSIARLAFLLKDAEQCNLQRNRIQSSNLKVLLKVYN